MANQLFSIILVVVTILSNTLLAIDGRETSSVTSLPAESTFTVADVLSLDSLSDPTSMPMKFKYEVKDTPLEGIDNFAKMKDLPYAAAEVRRWAQVWLNWWFNTGEVKDYREFEPAAVKNKDVTELFLLYTTLRKSGRIFGTATIENFDMAFDHTIHYHHE